MLSREDRRPRVKDQRDNESRKPETKPRITLSASTSQQDTGRIEAQIAIFREQPDAKVIVIPNATHFIFLSREAEVISQISEFVNSLPAKR